MWSTEEKQVALEEQLLAQSKEKDDLQRPDDLLRRAVSIRAM